MFAELDNTAVVTADKIEKQNLSLIVNRPIDDKFFELHSGFFRR